VKKKNKTDRPKKKKTIKRGRNVEMDRRERIPFLLFAFEVVWESNFFFCGGSFPTVFCGFP